MKQHLFTEGQMEIVHDGTSTGLLLGRVASRLG
jgi:hypothetical protein